MVLGAIGVYVFYASAGRWSDWPVYWGFYDHLADAFRSGQLHLLVEPHPLLLAQTDPYDPRHRSLWAWDFSLYRGKYYLYWGPVPAFFQAAGKMALGIWGRVGDQYLVFTFCCLSLVFATLLVAKVARRVFPRVPGYLVVVAALVMAFAHPTPHMLSSGGHYQAAIVGAQAFLLGGLVAACDAVWLAAFGRAPRSRLILAGSAWALALGCRVSAGPAVALLMAASVIGVARPTRDRLRKAAWDIVILAAPVALTVFALLLYNRARFDAWLDFGVQYQLSTMKFRTSAAFVPLNVYSYLFRWPKLECAFPFVFQERNVDAQRFPGWMELPQDYSTAEPLLGMLVVVPWAWLAGLGIVLYPWRCWRAARRGETGGSSHGTRLGLWCAASFATMALVMTLPTIALFIATMRYLGDSTPGVLLTAILGAFSLYDSAHEKPVLKRVVGIGLCGVAAPTIVLGLLLGIQGYDDHFRVNNPELYAKLGHALSFCPNPAATASPK